MDISIPPGATLGWVSTAPNQLEPSLFRGCVGNCALVPLMAIKVFIFGLGFCGQRLAKWLKRPSRRACTVVGTVKDAEEKAAVEAQEIGVSSVLVLGEDTELLATELRSATHVLSTVPPSRGDGVQEDPVLAAAGALLKDTWRDGRLRWIGYLSSNSVSAVSANAPCRSACCAGPERWFQHRVASAPPAGLR